MTHLAESHRTSSWAAGNPSRGAWRATTATRVFGLALAVGHVLAADALTRALPALVSLVLLATVASVIEAGPTVRLSWVPIVEALLAAMLLAGLLPGGALFAYLAVPAVVAGIGQGWVTAVNASLTGALGFYAASMTTRDLLVVPEDVDAAGLWLVVGLGAGLLAGWQTRSLRQVETRQAPYAAAHRLVAELSELTRSSELGLDPVAVAQQLGQRVADATGTIRWAVYVAHTSGERESLAAHEPLPLFLELARQFRGRRGASDRGTAVIPLRVGDHRFGVVVLDREHTWSRYDLGEAQHAVDELAVRLETALLFDQVRDVATAEERHRLARDIHDGVAQEMVALGYLVDEIEDTSAEAQTLRAASTLRREISRLVGELRFSIFDLRHEVDEQHLSGALAQYVREVSADTDLRVHLVLDEQGPPLSPRTESELLRIAQEAIGNVRRHARADNLWVTFATIGPALHLEVADDGVGHAAPRQRHYGLHTMRERAARLNADLSVHERPGGGTVVTLISGSFEPTAPHPRAEVTA